MQEIDQLQKVNGSDKVLNYSINEVEDVILVNLPVSGLKGAIADFPGGRMIIKSPIGSFEIPFAAVQSVLTEGFAEKLQVRIGSLLAEQEDKINRHFKLEGAVKLGHTVKIELLWRSGEIEKQVKGLGGSKASFTFHLADPADPTTTTVLSHDIAVGKTFFVPAVVERIESGTSDIKLILSETGVFSVISLDKIFADMSDHWAKQEVSLLASKHLIEGMDDLHFAPDKPITRAQFTTLLVRALGWKEGQEQITFSDVKQDAWYAGAVGTASARGLTEGFKNGKFQPNDLIRGNR
ncbi:hypothetical protein UB51_07410 [Paenibacillus sp. IHBB 10380]|nr:hypothetical protein UB51_07410 [Paenibacillus sp. IHBB 10380]